MYILEGQHVYRGEVAELNQDYIVVNQLPGFNYGQPSIRFALSSASKVPETPLVLGSYVQVGFNGMLTRSIPPQAHAEYVRQLAPFSMGILLCGEVLEVTQTPHGTSILMQPFQESEENRVVLHVPETAWEGIALQDVRQGTQLCAITHGLAAMSLPPQYPVQLVLPYQP